MDRIKIAYQNKDITSKALADGTAAIVDYESEYSEKDKIKYLNYITGTANRYVKAKRDCPILRMIVIYTGDIKREQIVEEYHIGAISLKIETACLSELNAQEILTRLKEKVERKEQLTDEELMGFIILPLSYHKIEEKEEKIKETVELATKIADRQQQIFTLAGIAVFTDKIIDKETAGKIRRMIEMTQIAQIFEEEKQQALLQVFEIFEEEKRQALQQAAESYETEKRQALQQAAESYEEEKRQALQQAAESYETEKRQTAESYEIEKRQMVIKMLKRNYPVEEIISLMPGYSQKDVEKLRKSLLK